MFPWLNAKHPLSLPKSNTHLESRQFLPALVRTGCRAGSDRHLFQSCAAAARELHRKDAKTCRIIWH